MQCVNNILQRFNASINYLQDADKQLDSVVNLLRSINSFLEEIRDKFSEYESSAKDLCDNKFYKNAMRRILGRKKQR